MRNLFACLLSLFLILAFTGQSFAQQTQASSAASSTSASPVPRLIKFSGTLLDHQGQPLKGPVGVTFSLYAQQSGDAPLWMETQNVELDAKGVYAVLLGANTATGLPEEMFRSGEARWLGIQPEREPELPRILLVSAPYALKAADAETLGGLPASAFMLASSPSNVSLSAIASTPVPAPTSGIAAPAGVTNVTTTGGTANYLSIFTSASTIIDSIVYQTGTGAAAKVGINTITPAATLDVNGSVDLEGPLTLAATGTATTAAGKNSQPQDLVASSYSSTSKAAANQTFQWQAEAASNDTATPSGSLNLLFGSGVAAPAETGMKLSNKGIFTFAPGQTFPGTGTITGITTAIGSGLTGGGLSGTLSLSVPAAGVTNTMLQHPSLTLTPGGGMSGGGVVALGGSTTIGLKNCANNQVLEFIGTAWTCSNVPIGTITGVTAGTDLTGGGITGNVTLNLDTTKVPRLAATNTFVGNQSVTGNVTASGVVQGGMVNATSSFDLAGTPFAFGSTVTQSAFLGFAGSAVATGSYNTASGSLALYNNTGSYNTANGVGALQFNTSGGTNTASGAYALNSNIIGIDNTASGASALQLNTGDSDNTASGANALRHNTEGGFNTASGKGALFFNTKGLFNTADGNDALLFNTTGSYNTALGYGAGSDSSQANLTNATAIGAYSDVAESNALVLGSISGVNGATASVRVGIGTSTPAATLEVRDNGSGGSTISATSAAVNNAVSGVNTSTSGLAKGGYFATSSPQGTAVVGVNFGSGYAGYFQGNVHVTGNLSKGGGSFKIDHPLDPANKYLYHSFVESPDMMNVYNGNVVTDKRGMATVVLPEYFEALNRDFRYQLTVVGQFAQAIVAKEVHQNRFVIRTSKPNVEVSWQVTGIRQDAYANAHRIEVEEDKPQQEQGHYLHPELFGAPPEKAVGYQAAATPTHAETARVSTSTTPLTPLK